MCFVEIIMFEVMNRTKKAKSNETENQQGRRRKRENIDKYHDFVPCGYIRTLFSVPKQIVWLQETKMLWNWQRFSIEKFCMHFCCVSAATQAPAAGHTMREKLRASHHSRVCIANKQKFRYKRNSAAQGARGEENVEFFYLLLLFESCAWFAILWACEKKPADVWCALLTNTGAPHTYTHTCTKFVCVLHTVHNPHRPYHQELTIVTGLNLRNEGKTRVKKASAATTTAITVCIRTLSHFGCICVRSCACACVFIVLFSPRTLAALCSLCMRNNNIMKCFNCVYFHGSQMSNRSVFSVLLLSRCPFCFAWNNKCESRCFYVHFVVGWLAG